MDTYENATKEERTAALEALRLSLTAEFVPWSKSRNKDKPTRSLNWKVTLSQGDKKLIRTDYMQGIWHAPSYKATVIELGNQNSLMREPEIIREAETGLHYKTREPLPAPSLLEVCHCLGMAAQEGAESFEYFCANFGYDTDSRKARKAWKACRGTAYKLGRELTESINKVCEGY